MDFREADILDLDAMHKACAGVDYVLHQAAIPSVPKSVLDPSAATAPTSTARSMFWSRRATRK